MSFTEPDRDCELCPRLRGFLLDLREKHPDWHNAPVPSFGDPNAELLIVGLAPGMHGANRTGDPLRAIGPATYYMRPSINMGFQTANMMPTSMTASRSNAQ